MSLSTVVQLRYAALLPQLTNPTSGGPSTASTTVLDEAIKMTRAHFFDQVGLILDDVTPNESHLLVGGKLCIYFLKDLRGQLTEQDRTDYTAIQKLLYSQSKKLGGGSAWVTPTTNSNLEPTREKAGTRPWSDPVNFQDITPADPSRDRGRADEGTLE